MTFVAALALFAASDLAAAPPAAPPPDLRDFAVMQFISSNGTAPDTILRLDDNGQIVRACVAPHTREALRAEGIAVTDSQVELLKAWRLLDEREGGVLATAIAVLPPARAERLRAASRRATPALLERVSKDLDAFRAQLATAKRPGAEYTMLFSYVLDDLVWREWVRGGLVERREVTATTPFWSGVVWATAPKRAFSMGTNSVGRDGASLNVNWTHAAIPRLRPFVADMDTLETVFDDYLKGGAVVTPRAKQVFGPFGLFDGAGHLTLPVVVEGGSDPLYAAARGLASAVAREVPRLVDADGLAKELGLGTREAALVIVYHEIMWDLMDELERRGAVAKPRMFADPASAGPADVVFVVREAAVAR